MQRAAKLSRLGFTVQGNRRIQRVGIQGNHALNAGPGSVELRDSSQQRTGRIFGRCLAQSYLPCKFGGVGAVFAANSTPNIPSLVIASPLYPVRETAGRPATHEPRDDCA